MERKEDGLVLAPGPGERLLSSTGTSRPGWSAKASWSSVGLGPQPRAGSRLREIALPPRRRASIGPAHSGRTAKPASPAHGVSEAPPRALRPGAAGYRRAAQELAISSSTMVFALSTGHEIGLALVGGAFIVFALLSSFVFPRRNPNFPGRRGMLWYIPLCVCVLHRDDRRHPGVRQGEAGRNRLGGAACGLDAEFLRGRAERREADERPLRQRQRHGGQDRVHGRRRLRRLSHLHRSRRVRPGTTGPDLDKVAAYAQMAHISAAVGHRLRAITQLLRRRSRPVQGSATNRHADDVLRTLWSATDIADVWSRGSSRLRHRVRRGRAPQPALRYHPGLGRSGRVAEGGALLRRYGGLILHRGFESLLLRRAGI